MMNSSKKRVGVFDSGLGGLSVLKECLGRLRDTEFSYYADTAFAPYGPRDRGEIIDRSRRIARRLLSRGADALLIACNTATSAAVQTLRKELRVPVVGMEPALKPAMERVPQGEILVMGTPFTVREKKFRALAARLGAGRRLRVLPCPGIVRLMEKGLWDGDEMDALLEKLLRSYVGGEVRAVVLGCTHYVFLRDKIQAVFGGETRLFDGNRGTARQLARVIGQRIENVPYKDAAPRREIGIDSSGDLEHVLSLCRWLLKDVSFSKI